MSPQSLFSFEQVIVDAEQAAKQARIDADNAAKAARRQRWEAMKDLRRREKERLDREKATRRLMREAAYKQRHPPGHAQCGINWYPAGSGWSHCHKCGQALVYTTDRNAKPQECKGRKP
jgi:hypothetical protein